MDWKAQIPACLGQVDRKFAVHPLDEQWARQMITDAKAAGASIDDVSKEIAWDCYKSGVRVDLAKNIDEQLQRLNALW